MISLSGTSQHSERKTRAKSMLLLSCLLASLRDGTLYRVGLLALSATMTISSGCGTEHDDSPLHGDASWHLGGVVVDSVSGLPLEGAEVTATDAADVCVRDSTDQVGRYSLFLGLSLYWNVEYSRSGFAAREIQFQGVGSCDSIEGAACIKDVALAPASP